MLRDRFTDLIFLSSPVNAGFAGGCNIGLQYAIDHGYTYSLLLNADTFVQPGFLSVLVEYMDQHPHSGAVQPKIYYNYDRRILWNGGSRYNRWLGITYSSGFKHQDGPQQNTIQPVDWITGCAFLVKNSVLQEVGLFDPAFFMYYEDVDLSFRIRKHGYQLIYHPLSVIYHIAGVSTKKTVKDHEGWVLPLVHYYNIRNRIWILKKYTKPLFAPTVVIFSIFYGTMILLYFAIRLRFKKFRAAFRGIADGLQKHGVLNT